MAEDVPEPEPEKEWSCEPPPPVEPVGLGVPPTPDGPTAILPNPVEVKQPPT